RNDLGDWIHCCLKNGFQDQGAKVERVLSACAVPLLKLQNEWKAQKAAQLSIHAYAPARLKKELDTVLTLQTDLDSAEKALQHARTTIAKGEASEGTLALLAGLERAHRRVMDKVETLYSSLNFHDCVPELNSIDLKFVQSLLMVRNLKINI
ncbi:hypothetical protein BV22DRAFT_987045, partial [Leucogyrophana mollusca]